MAEQVFRSIATEGKRIPTWDVESILTRAVYRALNNTGSNQLVNAEQLTYPANVDKNRVTTDAQLQLRLIAEKLCTRVERRYEKRLLQQREKDRVDTDRKLADIRAEYAEQMEMRKRELDRARLRLEEQFAEKDRLLRHKIELQLSEKESALEITRKSLETRVAELAMNKEQLDRAKAEFQAKFASDVEVLNQEWAKIRGKQEELRSAFRNEFDVEQQSLVERSADLEKENAELKKKLGDSNAELYQIRSQLTKVPVLEDDLRAANERIRLEVLERQRLSRCSYEVERLRDENAFLKEELEQLKSFARESRSQNAQKAAPTANKEESYLVKISELKTIIRMMSEKINSLTSERNYLREMLRGSRRDLVTDQQGRARAPQTSGALRDFRSRTQIRETDSSEDTSISSSSGCASDLRNIKQRFSTLEDLAKSENYDDFCRSVQGKVDRYSSPKKTVGNEPEKSAARQGPIAALATEYRIKDSDAASTGLSPAIEPASDALMSKPAASDQTAEQRQVQTDSVAQNQPSTAPVDTFAERLRARNELKRTLKFAAIARGEGPAKEETVPSKTQSPAEAEDVMGKYLALITTKRREEEEQKQTSTPKPKEDPTVEFPVQVEDVVVDKPTNSGDEIDW
ncbi:unnamed protein product [Heligmosomoides polygyrus]|uniref:Cilia- and flagella-associated protein 157 n=1 Tax=Heligmosomoides polygyrus TaxID=6339 RepID=A0A183FD74_HELPZ|nr:unnamed protein product [Heligmosomoides polygyrus]